MDILDTSFIRGTKKNDILEIGKLRPLAVSPFTLWEILCHLDEVREGETAEAGFLRRKGHVEILQHVTILDDPFAQHALTVGAVHLANPSRFEDKAVAAEIVKRVAASPTLDDLNKEIFTYPDGGRASFRDIAARARAALEAEEKAYIANTQKMWERVRSESAIENPALLKDDELWKWLSAMLKALKASYEKDGVATEMLLLRIVESMYPYYGYLFERLRTYSKGTDGTLSIQPNDTEDGYICMHMRLLENDVLVSGDGKTVRAVEEALKLWDVKVPKLPSVCRAVTALEYRKMHLPGA